jgi:outer membrane receptor protein involved in Fe transport
LNFRATKQFTLSVGVKNVSNVDVPLELYANTVSPHLANGSTSGAAGAAYYDAIGRYFFTKLNLNF